MPGQQNQLDDKPTPQANQPNKTGLEACGYMHWLASRRIDL